MGGDVVTPMETPQKKKVADMIDSIDLWSIQTGMLMKNNPIIRLAFLMYLLVMHIWVLFVLVFHAHNLEAGGNEGGSYRHAEQNAPTFPGQN